MGDVVCGVRGTRGTIHRGPLARRTGCLPCLNTKVQHFDDGDDSLPRTCCTERFGLQRYKNPVFGSRYFFGACIIYQQVCAFSIDSTQRLWQSACGHNKSYNNIHSKLKQSRRWSISFQRFEGMSKTGDIGGLSTSERSLRCPRTMWIINSAPQHLAFCKRWKLCAAGRASTYCAR